MIKPNIVHQELFETGAPGHVETCNGCCQSDTLMSELLLGIRKQLGAMSRQKPKVVVDHTALRTNMVKLGLTQQQDCRLCGDKKKIF